jgi:hypothetical protein
MKIKLLGVLVFGALLLLGGCEYDDSEAIWDPDADLGGIPTITQIDPADSAGIGVTEIRILGESLGESEAKTGVYFESLKATIKQFSPTEIVVYRPALIGDDITIKVQVDGAYVIAKSWHYKIPAVYRSYGGFIQNGPISILDVSKDDNIYLMFRKDIYKVTPDETNYKVGAQGFTGTTSDIKMGPGGFLYMKKSNFATVYRLNVAAENAALEAEEFGTLARKANYIDFDEYGNLYGGGTNAGISVLKNGTSALVGDFADLDIKGLRVFDGYVYVFDSENNIWRAAIQDQNGTLANKEPVFAWANAGDYAASTLSAIDFAADGTIYCGTDHANPVFLLYADGTIEPLYPGILTPTAKEIVWSNHGDIFVNQTTTVGTPDLYLLRVGKEGAPYYGRTLE